MSEDNAAKDAKPYLPTYLECKVKQTISALFDIFNFHLFCDVQTD